MFSEERLRLLQILAQKGINGSTFSVAELRQRAQKIISREKLNAMGLNTVKSKRKRGSSGTKKIPNK